MISASLVTAIFVLILISTIFAMFTGKPATLRFAALVYIFFGWGCPILAVIAIIVGVLWIVLMLNIKSSD